MMSINNPNFPPADRRVEEAQKELLRIPKTSHIGSNTGSIHASTFQVTKTLGRQIAPAPGAVIGNKALTPQQISTLTSTIHKKEIQKNPISLSTSTPMTTSMSNIIPVQITGTTAASVTHANTALHVHNVSSIVRAAVPGSTNHPTAQFSHLPRGVVAAQAVRAGSTVSIQRQALPSSIQMSSHTASLPHNIQSQIRNVLPQSIRPGTPPANRSISPVISIGTAQPTDSHRTNISLHNATTVSNSPSIQITLQASRTANEGIKPVTTYQAGSKVHVNQGLNMTTQSKVLMSHSLTPVLQHPTLAAKGNRGQPAGTTPLSTVTIALTTATVTIPILSSGTTSSSIPIAKVPPQRQHQSGAHSTPTPHTSEPRSESTTFSQPALSHSQPTTQAHVPPHTMSQPATSLFIPQPRGSQIITTVTSNASSTETRDSLPTMPFFPPYMLSPDNPYYQQLMRYQVAAVAQQQARPSIITPQNTASLAASLQASHAGGQPSVTRLSHPLMVMHDSLRQTAPQTTQSAHAPFHTAGTEGQTKVTSANTESITPLTVPAPTQVSSISLAAVYPTSTHNSHVSHVMHQTSHQGVSSIPSSTPVNNPSASPRPSILRKRTNEGISTVKKQLALTSGPEVHSPRPDSRPDSTPQSNMSSPKTPASGESQSSTDTALSSEATTPTQLNHDKVKHEPPEHQENGYPSSNTPEASPRKRRKQLLQVTEEIRDTPVNVFDKLVEACVKEEEEDEEFDDDDDLDDTLTDDEKLEIKEGHEPVRAGNALDIMKYEANLKYPNRILATNLRKHTATISQVMDLQDHELKWLTNHLGHTAKVHLTHYRATSGLIERLDTAKIMFLQEKNNVGKFSGRKMSEIQFQDLDGETQSLVEDIQDRELNEEVEFLNGTDEADEVPFTGKKKAKTEYIDEEGIRWTVEKCRSGVTLLNFYNISWKPKNNHFVRYSDVKAKDERRPSVNELSNQKGVLQKASGWKLYHMAAQIEDLVALEKDLNDKLVELQSIVAPSPPPRHSILEDESVMLHELTQGNIQRCKLITDQLAEAKSSMLKVLEHKPKISEIISKHMSKRPIKKKERT